MAIKKMYSSSEVTVLMELYENCSNSRTGNAKSAHSISKHAVDKAALQSRIQQGNLCPSTYLNKKTLIDATTEALNSPEGQKVLAAIEDGELDREQIECNFKGKHSAFAEYGDEFKFPLGLVDDKETGKGKPIYGDLGGSGVVSAKVGIVLVERYTKNQIWIQTSYPLL